MYFKGEGVSKDYKIAYDYFTSYEDNQSFTKPYCLAEMYRQGLYVERNIDKAKELYHIITDDTSPYAKEDQYYDWALEKLKELEK